jgi:hypothetical protein
MNRLDLEEEDINTQYTRKLIYAIYYRREEEILRLLEINFTLSNQQENLLKLEKSIANNSTFNKALNSKIYLYYEVYYDTCTLKKNNNNSLTFEIYNQRRLSFSNASLLMLAIVKNTLHTTCSPVIIQKLLEKYPSVNTYDQEVLFLQENHTRLYVRCVFRDYDSCNYVCNSYYIFNPQFISKENRQVLNNFIKKKYLEISHLNRDVDSIIIKYAGWS